MTLRTIADGGLTQVRSYARRYASALGRERRLAGHTRGRSCGKPRDACHTTFPGDDA